MSSNQQTVGQRLDQGIIDSKSFYDKYIDHRKWVFVLTIIFLILGFILFFQVCGAEMSGSDPSGLAGSSVGSSNSDGDGDELNPTVVGLLEFTALVIIAVCVGVLCYYWSIVQSSKKLIKAGNFYGAAEINLKKGQSASPELFQAQVELMEQTAAKMGVTTQYMKTAKDVELIEKGKKAGKPKYVGGGSAYSGSSRGSSASSTGTGDSSSSGDEA